MDEFTAGALVNRDDPIPVMSFDAEDELSVTGDGSPADGRRRDRLMQHAKNLKDNVRKGHSRGSSESGFSMQDRLLEK